MKTEKNSLLGLYMIGIAALFLAGFFMLVLFGAQTYRNTVAAQTGNNEARSFQSYLTNSIGSGDSEGSVKVIEAGGAGFEAADGQVLLIADGSTGYALKIYQKDGVILEEYAKITAQLKPDNAEKIGGTSVFEIEQIREDTLRFTTDEGSFLVHTRSAGGVAQE